MTPPRPTASAAELREVFIGEWNTREHWDSGGARMGAALDALIAAVRAEALEEQAQALEDDGIAWIDQNADKARLVASGWWPRVVPARVPVDSDETGGEG